MFHFASTSAMLVVLGNSKFQFNLLLARCHYSPAVLEIRMRHLGRHGNRSESDRRALQAVLRQQAAVCRFHRAAHHQVAHHQADHHRARVQALAPLPPPQCACQGWNTLLTSSIWAMKQRPQRGRHRRHVRSSYDHGRSKTRTTWISKSSPRTRFQMVQA